jgi:hypothetical protein
LDMFITNIGQKNYLERGFKMIKKIKYFIWKIKNKKKNAVKRYIY